MREKPVRIKSVMTPIIKLLFIYGTSSFFVIFKYKYL